MSDTITLNYYNSNDAVFAGNQYLMYEMINERPDLHKRFEERYPDTDALINKLDIRDYCKMYQEKVNME